MLELRRAGLGFGRLIVDDTGVTRRGLVRTAAIAWHELREYRIQIQLFSASGSRMDGALLGLQIENYVDGLRGDSAPRASLELYDLAGRRRLAFGWQFVGYELAIGEVLGRLAQPALARAQAELARTGTASFGALALSAHAIRLGAGEPLPRDRVEALELFDQSPVTVRVMQLGKAWHHARASLHDVPNVATALELARELGYTVRGARLLDRFQGRTRRLDLTAPRP